MLEEILEYTEVIIYQPAKHAMQSGMVKTNQWVIEPKAQARKEKDSLMGWHGGSNSFSQVKLIFDQLEEAIAFCNKKDISYVVKYPKKRKRIAKAYADNFAFDKKESWTH